MVACLFLAIDAIKELTVFTASLNSEIKVKILNKTHIPHTLTDFSHLNQILLYIIKLIKYI